jgi:formate hydrogenlyase subunit 4
MKEIIISVVQSLVLIALTPLFIGIIKKLKATFRGFTGPSVFQVYYDLNKLFNKGRVISNTSSFITAIGPSISLAAALTSAFLVPVFFTAKGFMVGNLFVIIFVLAIVKFFNTLIGLDTASAFGGMGTSRELFISMLAEPATFIIIVFLFFQSKTLNIFDISFVNAHLASYNTERIIAAVSFFVVILAENARLPVDNPETHLELTMIHEAMILDISGSDLALVELASYVKMIVFLTIFINGFMPFGIAVNMTAGSILIGIAAFLIKMFLALTLLSVIEVSMAKSRLFRVPELLTGALAVGVLAVVINYFL